MTTFLTFLVPIIVIAFVATLFYVAAKYFPGIPSCTGNCNQGRDCTCKN